MRNFTIRSISILLVHFTILSFTCLGQNQTTAEGLRFGYWTEEYQIKKTTATGTGNYKIIPLNTYSSMEKIVENIYAIRYKHSITDLLVFGQNEQDISVKDSIWTTVSSTGKLREEILWNNGIIIWFKHYDNMGHLQKYDYTDFENDTNFYLTYKGSQLFKKEYYPPNDKDHSTILFYPDHNLIIENAEPSFKSIFGNSDLSSYQIRLAAKNDLKILSVHSRSKNIGVNASSLVLPMTLTSKDTVAFDLIFKPTPKAFRKTGIVTIQTSDPNMHAYRIYCSLYATHIDSNNIATIDHLSLSKTRDRYLIIGRMGAPAKASITNTKGKHRSYRIRGITKIDLKKFRKGKYKVNIGNRNRSDIKLRIVK